MNTIPQIDTTIYNNCENGTSYTNECTFTVCEGASNAMIFCVHNPNTKNHYFYQWYIKDLLLGDVLQAPYKLPWRL